MGSAKTPKKSLRFVLTVICITAGLYSNHARADFTKSHLEAFHRKNNCGVFIGVSDFISNRVYPLKFAANDAIAQAWMFVVELKLIPPHNCEIILSGRESDLKEPYRSQLKQLKQMGVKHSLAIRKLIQDAFKNASARTFDDNLLVFSISSHGFHDGQAYVMAYDSEPDAAEAHDKGLALADIESLLKQAKGKKILLVDACRENMEKQDGTKAIIIKPISLAKKANINATYHLLASCAPGQYSYEDPKSGHGLFTQALLTGLRGEASYKNQISLSTLERHTVSYVARWVAENGKRHPQIPRFSGMSQSQDLLLRQVNSGAASGSNQMIRRPAIIASLTDKYQAVGKISITDDVIDMSLNAQGDGLILSEDGSLHLVAVAGKTPKLKKTYRNFMPRGKRQNRIRWVGDQLLTVDYKGKAQMWKLKADALEVPGTLGAPEAPEAVWSSLQEAEVLSIRVTNNSIVLGLNNGELVWLDSASGEKTKVTDYSWTLRKPLKGMAISQDLSRVAAFSGRAFQSFGVNGGGKLKFNGKGHVTNMTAMGFVGTSGVGQTLWTADRIGRVLEWVPGAADNIELIKRGSMIQALSVRHDGLACLVSQGSFDGAGVQLVRANHGQKSEKPAVSKLKITPTPREIAGATFSSDGVLLGFGSGKSVHLYRTEP